MTTEIEIDQNDADLDYVRQKRKSIIESMMPDGKPPEDTKAVGVILMALADMDRASIGKKRIKTDVNLGNMQAQAMEMIASIYQNHDVKKLATAGIIPRTAPPEIDDELPMPPIVAGELAIGIGSEDYNLFMNRTAK